MAKLDIERLCTAARRSYKILEPYRTQHRQMVNAYAGSRWAGTGSKKRTLLNLISQYISIVSRGVISKAPRVMLSVLDKEAEPVVAAMEDWINKVEIERMEIAATLRRIQTNALFSFGIAKVGLSTPADSARYAWDLDAGLPFLQSVELEDFCVDMEAKDIREVDFIGHRVRVHLEAAKAFYGKKAKDLQASEPSTYNPDGDERLSTLGRGIYGTAHEEIEDTVELWEFYIPHHKMIVTLTSDDVSGATASQNGMEPVALHEQDWVGHDSGPFVVLGFMEVPGNLIPKGPVMDLFDLAWDVNKHYRKLSESAQAFKKVMLVQAGATQDAEEYRTANNGDILRNDNPTSAKELTSGGADPGLIQFAIHCKDLFDFAAGNMALLGGLAPQSKTLGQDQMLNQNASGMVQSLQAQSVEFVKDVVERLTWYFKYDPYRDMKFQYDGPEGIKAPMKVTPEQRAAIDWSTTCVDIDPYSMPHQTPQQRAGTLIEIVKGVVLPMMPLLQERGIVFDVDYLLKKLAKYYDLSDLQKMLTLQEPPTADVGPSEGGTPATMGQETTRNYVRRSLGGDTAQNREATFQNTLAQQAAKPNGQMQTAGA